MKSHIGAGLCALTIATLSLLSSAAKAADPVVAGNTSIGTDSAYGSGYSAFWRNGKDYSLLTNGTDTFLNAPALAGTIHFRTANHGDWMSLTQSSLSITVPTTISSQTIFASDIVVDGPLYAYDGGDLYGDFMFENGLLAVQNAGAWTGVFDGVDYGLTARGTTYGIYSEGPIYGTSNLSISGPAYKPGGGSWLALSDIRVKRDVTEFTPGLAEVENIRPVRYKYNGLGGTQDTGKEYVGVIAQQLEKVMPFMVSSEPKKLHPNDTQMTDIKEVDPSAFTYTLINAVQELAKQNRELKRVLCKDHPGEALCREGKL